MTSTRILAGPGASGRSYIAHRQLEVTVLAELTVSRRLVTMHHCRSADPYRTGCLLEPESDTYEDRTVTYEVLCNGSLPVGSRKYKLCSAF